MGEDDTGTCGTVAGAPDGSLPRVASVSSPLISVASADRCGAPVAAPGPADGRIAPAGAIASSLTDSGGGRSVSASGGGTARCETGAEPQDGTDAPLPSRAVSDRPLRTLSDGIGAGVEAGPSTVCEDVANGVDVGDVDGTGVPDAVGATGVVTGGDGATGGGSGAGDSNAGGMAGNGMVTGGGTVAGGVVVRGRPRPMTGPGRHRAPWTAPYSHPARRRGYRPSAADR